MAVIDCTTRQTRDSTPEELAAIEADREANPVRLLIPKSVIHERVEAIGKLGIAFAALNSQPLQFARWFSPDWPQVYFDDENLLALLAGIGCTEPEIATITAPA